MAPWRGTGGATTTASGDLLHMWAGGLLFAAYGVGFAGAGTRLIAERDVP